MRILFTPLAWPTHYYPMVGLVWACRAAGHDVRVAGQPPVLDAVLRTGTVPVSVGGDFDFMAAAGELQLKREEIARRVDLTDVRRLPPDVLRELHELRMTPHIRMAEDMAGDLVAFTRAWRPDLVISDPLVYAAPIAAAVAGAPLVRHLWGPDMMRNIGLPGTGMTEEGDIRGEWPAALAGLYARYGAEPRADVAVRTVDPCPESLQVPGLPNRIPVRYVPYNGTAVAPAWTLEATDRPRVCVTWGTATTRLMGPGAFLVPLILDALAKLDVEVILTLKQSDRGLLEDVPEGVRIVETMPLDLLLPTCDAIIHQAGAGTMLTAACFGVPQVTIAQVADQGLVGERLSRTGAGVGFTGDDLDADSLREAASSVIFDGGTRAAARRLQEEILAQPAPAEIVASLEGLLSERSL